MSTSSEHPFNTSTYTVDEYKIDANTNPDMSIEQHAEKLCKCVASSTIGFIVKRRTPTGYEYQEMRARELKDTVLSFSIPFVKETKKVDSRGNVYVANSEIKFKNVVDVISDPQSRPNLAYYDKLVLVAQSKHELGRCVPPLGPYDDALGERLIQFLRSRINNTRAFDELISSHVYRLRHPDAFIEKCFVHYSPQGNTGKTFLAGMLGMLYPKAANVAVKHSQLTENINGWTANYMMIQVEELEGNEYLTKEFQAWIKRATVRDTSIRVMNKDAYAGQNNAIIGLNTNKTDLYGLVYGDEALISRLVILDFKEPLTPEEWTNIKISFGLDEKDEQYREHKQFLASSLYHYLKYSYDIIDKFDPCRYYNSEKDELIKRLRSSAGSVPDAFVNQLEKITPENRTQINAVFEAVKKKSGEYKDKVMVMIRASNIRSAWRSFLQGKRGNQANYSFEKSVEPLLENIGFIKRHTREGEAWLCHIEKFNEWYDNRLQTESIDIEEDEIIDF